ncbi:chemotaxis protein CheW [Flammeovirgaceae bacterium SG7u.111]|nr:chemotaxis protein CheW [Flammeovirgaceae bacterium SG7u.132]WPO33386.1 chemotaxis protein CheW [Flammeovirgaceae bacterium SG7u.111]
MNYEEEISQNLKSFLSFKLSKEMFAIEVEKVVEILEVSKITHVPKAPEYMKGVINLRGKVLPLIDTCLKFGLPAIELKTETCIVVILIEINKELTHMGILVDEVMEVVEMDEKEIQPTPGLENKNKLEFIKGILKVDEEFLMILDLDKAFSLDEINSVKNSEEEATVV